MRVGVLVVASWVALAACGGDDDDDHGPGDGDADADGDGDADLPAECGNLVVDGEEECEGLSGCAEGDQCTADCACEPLPALPPTSQALIAQALEDGTIDYHTSLMYRVWALFQAPELPEEYDGVGSRGEDTHLFFELASERAALPAEIEAAVAPYLVRPNDPASIYAQTTFQIGGGGDQHYVGCPAGADGLSDWRPYGTDHFVVWSCGGGVDGADPLAGSRVVAGTVLEQAWTEMIRPEGGDGFLQFLAPRDDDLRVGPDPQGRIDVYLVTPNQCRIRAFACVQVDTLHQLAVAAHASPCDTGRGIPETSSGYIVIDAAQVPAAAGASPFRVTAAHELFHLVQFGLNLRAMGFDCLQSYDETWLTEASAEWASHSFFKNDDPQRRTDWFEDFQNRRDDTRLGLSSTLDTLPYSAFLYPAFIEEEDLSPQIMVALWAEGNSARSGAELEDRLGTLFDYGEHFRDFTVRNFNRNLPGNPLVESHQSFDAALPFDREPYLSHVEEPGYRLGGVHRTDDMPLKIAPLAMQTEHFEFLPEMRWARFDGTGVGNAGHLQLDALVKIDDEWHRRELDTPVLEICRDDEDGDVEEAYLIWSNFDHAREGGRIDDDYELEKGPACPGGWSGSIRIVNSDEEHWAYTLAGDYFAYDSSIMSTQTWFLGATRIDENGEQLIDASWRSSYAIDRTEVDPNTGCQRTSRTTGAGDGSGDTTFRVLINAEDGTVLTLQPTTDAGEYSFTEHTAYEDCQGSNGWDSQGTIREDWFILGSNEQFTPLVPDPRDPNHFRGDATIQHDEEVVEGGTHVSDIRAHWDLYRRPTTGQ